MVKIEKDIFKLHFVSPLHLSKGKLDSYDLSLKILHSDTLKSAIFVCALQLYGKENINEDFLDSFVISSAFPFWQDEYFFPKPMVKMPQIAKEEEAKQSKKLKKISFIGKSYFEQILQGNNTPIDSNHLLQNGEYLSKKISDKILNNLNSQNNTDKSFEEEKRNFALIHSGIQEKVYIPSEELEEDTQPYYLERLFFAKDAGLFFMIDYLKNKEIIKKQVTASIKLLGDNGIGTDRSAGNGQFEIRESELDLKINFQMPNTSKKQVNLSLYCPKKTELEDNLLENSAYNLLKRSGWLASAENDKHLSHRKKAIHMFAEGSVFPRQQLVGKKVDLQPSIINNAHEVWRDGQAMFFNLNTNEDNELH